MILQTNVAIGSNSFIGIMNQVHYIDNQLNFNFQSISLQVVNTFMIRYPYTTLQNQLHELYNFNAQRMVHYE